LGNKVCQQTEGKPSYGQGNSGRSGPCIRTIDLGNSIAQLSKEGLGTISLILIL